MGCMCVCVCVCIPYRIYIYIFVYINIYFLWFRKKPKRMPMKISGAPSLHRWFLFGILSSKLEMPWPSWILISVSSIQHDHSTLVGLPPFALQFIHCLQEKFRGGHRDNFTCFPSFREKMPAQLVSDCLETAASYFFWLSSCFWWEGKFSCETKSWAELEVTICNFKSDT